MIRSVEVVYRRVAEAMAGEGPTALIVIATPGCTIVAPPQVRALYASFDALAAELEAASLWLPGAAAAVPFTRAHALQMHDFVAALQRDSESVALRVTESEGLTRSVTVARWAAQRAGRPLLGPAAARGVTSCPLMAHELRAVGSIEQPRARADARCAHSAAAGTAQRLPA